MSTTVKRQVFAEKYPPFGLKRIITQKFEAVRCKNYESAAKYRDEEVDYYKNKYGYDISHTTVRPKISICEPEFIEMSQELQDFILNLLKTNE